ncbi:TrlF family AAA-like ATPase [Paenarthrobacter sp. CC6]|uniref:TrlF family AAA-like ATPase n=1 Tax=Paenarthrobacter sp. CC6 TaxID=3029184 RepID=UPI00339BB47F
MGEVQLKDAPQRGSEWRKWDLHVHVPNTQLNNQYTKIDGSVDLDRFCRTIHESDVSAVGLTDYFSFDGFFDVRERYDQLLRDGTLTGPRTLLIPNLELRLNDSVNKGGELIDYHLIFPPKLERAEAQEFLRNLKSSITDARSKPVNCGDLEGGQFLQATVTRQAIESAITETYGSKADRRDHLLLVAPVNGNGIRADGGNHRKRVIADEVDKLTDGFFGNKNCVAHFLETDRYDDAEQPSVPKPVFAGSDSHSFEDLENWLGKEVSGSTNDKNVTWIKADLTFDGLQQAFIEPAERVRMQASQPDFKEPYMHISSVRFQGTDDFPQEIFLNPNLNAIIGSRSSGKSALLAHIAHAVDPSYTETQQLAAGVEKDNLGPAAGHLWSGPGDLRCTVQWSDGVATSGKLIYIPQNSLFSISSRPDEITARIKPAVFGRDSAIQASYQSTTTKIDELNETIRDAIDDWFKSFSTHTDLGKQLREKGDKQAVQSGIDDLNREIENLQREANLTEDDAAAYKALSEQLNALERTLHDSSRAHTQLGQYVDATGEEVSAIDTIRVTVTTTPSSDGFPAEKLGELQSLVGEIEQDAQTRLRQFVLESWQALDRSIEATRQEIQKLKGENSELISRHEKAEGMAVPLKRLDTQKAVLADIQRLEDKLAAALAAQSESADKILSAVNDRRRLLKELCEDFNAENVGFDGIQFELESGLLEETRTLVSRDFNKKTSTPYVDRGQQEVRLDVIRGNPAAFLESIATGTQKLNQSTTPDKVAHIVLEATEDLRFVAIMDEDRIGGFSRSSMTPGKQALFSLRLILGESEDPWPLLLDQPEDDLDSRSIYETIVEELKSRKRERQIIMVTHDANLVIGADAEAVVVANRHGADRPNSDERTFDYLTGSLENTHRTDDATHTLGRAGIREHACDILDGGEAAFQKRKQKYNI